MKSCFLPGFCFAYISNAYTNIDSKMRLYNVLLTNFPVAKERVRSAIFVLKELH